MRVLQVAWEYPPRLFGGLGRHVEGLSAALAADGVDVTVLTPASSEPDPPSPDRLRVLRAAAPPELLPDDRWLADVLDANIAMAERALTSDVAVDVLHVHDWMAGHAARVLARAMGVPVVATVHATERGRHQGHLPPGISAWIDAQERALVGLADRVVVCSTPMVEAVTDWLGAPAADVIPNGVDPARWQPPGVRRRHDRVVVAGRLEYEKGVQVLMAATEDLPLDVRIAGRGSHGPALRREAHDRVRFEGHLPQPALARLLASATIVVVPSLYEPFGLAALEGMAAGTPVVVSDVGGLRDLVPDGVGLRVPPDDPTALRSALRRLLVDRPLRERLARAGLARAEELSWPATARRYRNVYTAVAPGRGG